MPRSKRSKAKTGKSNSGGSSSQAASSYVDGESDGIPFELMTTSHSRYPSISDAVNTWRKSGKLGTSIEVAFGDINGSLGTTQGHIFEAPSKDNESKLAKHLWLPRLQRIKQLCLVERGSPIPAHPINDHPTDGDTPASASIYSRNNQSDSTFVTKETEEISLDAGTKLSKFSGSEPKSDSKLSRQERRQGKRKNSTQKIGDTEPTGSLASTSSTTLNQEVLSADQPSTTSPEGWRTTRMRIANGLGHVGPEDNKDSKIGMILPDGTRVLEKDMVTTQRPSPDDPSQPITTISYRANGKSGRIEF